MRSFLFAAPLLAAVSLAACGQNASSEAGAPSAETETQRPSGMTLRLDPVVEGLENPWGIAFLPGEEGVLVTEKDRGLRLIRDGALVEAPLAGLPEAYTDRQAGYLGLVLDPDFATNRLVYLSFSEGTADANRTAVLKARLSDDASALEGGEVIFRSTDRSTGFHYGSRLAFLPDGTLLVSLGDGFRYMDEAQNTGNYHGKIVRLNTDGTIPADNPFADGPAPAIWSYGHRNIQGLYVDAATGTVWAHEHGPKGGDELNRIRPGANYGWPVITYGINYDGSIITRETTREGFEQPAMKWVPSIAPAGLTLLDSDVYPAWKGDLFVGGMEGPAGLKLVRVDLEGGEVVGREDLLTDIARPIRDVVQGNDGYLYVVTKELDSGLYRVVAE